MVKVGLRFRRNRASLKLVTTVVGATSMTTLAEIKHRHNLRKITDAPLVKILGPDQAAKDMDLALGLIDGQKDLLREVALYLRANFKQNDEVYTDLLNKVGQASE